MGIVTNMPDFNAARSMGIAPQPYDSYFDDGTSLPILNNPSYSLSGVQSQPFAAPLAIPQFDPLAEQAANDQATAQLLKRQATQDILSGQNDWNSEQGRSKLQNFVARGVIAPQQARAIISTVPKPQAQNRYSTVPVEVASAVSRLNQIDPTDPEAMTSLQKIIDPSIIPADIQTHPQFSSNFRELKKEILANKTHREVTGRHDPDEELSGKAMQAGLAPDELDAFVDQDGKITDKVGLRRAMYQAQHNSAVLGSDGRKRLDELNWSIVHPPTDEEKQDWLTRNGVAVNGATPEQWSAAFNGVRGEKEQLRNNYVTLLQQQGYRQLPKGGGGQQPVAIAQPPAQPQMPSFASEQEASAANLPPGSIVIINGRKARID